MNLFKTLLLEITIGALGYNLRRWVAEKEDKYVYRPILKWIGQRLRVTKRETAIWQHHRNKAARNGHQNRQANCRDGLCRIS